MLVTHRNLWQSVCHCLRRTKGWTRQFAVAATTQGDSQTAKVENKETQTEEKEPYAIPVSPECDDIVRRLVKRVKAHPSTAIVYYFHPGHYLEYIHHKLEEVLLAETKTDGTRNIIKMFPRDKPIHMNGGKQWIPMFTGVQRTQDNTEDGQMGGAVYDVSELIKGPQDKTVVCVFCIMNSHCRRRFLHWDFRWIKRNEGLHRNIKLKYILLLSPDMYKSHFNLGDVSSPRNRQLTRQQAVLYKRRLVYLNPVGYVVEMVPKFTDAGEFRAFLYFCNQMHLNQQKRIIPLLEGLCPGIGESLIMDGYCDMMMFTKDYPRRLYPKLFGKVTSSLLYEKSHMKFHGKRIGFDSFAPYLETEDGSDDIFGVHEEMDTNILHDDEHEEAEESFDWKE